MKTTIEILSEGAFLYQFKIIILNNTSEGVTVGIDNIKKSAESVGLLFEENDTVLKPVEFKVISSAGALEESRLEPGENITLSFPAKIKK